MRNSLLTAFAISLLMALILGACSRQNDFPQKANSSVLTENLHKWLHANGGIYSQESIKIRMVSGEEVTGKLDWNQLSEFIYKGKDYVSIPFIFGKYGMVLPGNDQVAPARFDLVIRKNEQDKFSGAVRTTMFGAKLKDGNGPRGRRIMQSYSLLSGQQATIWQSDMDYTHPKRMYRKSSATLNTSTNGTSPVATQSMFCDTYWYTTYETICWYTTEQDKINLNATCTSVANQSIVVECYSGEGGSGGDGGDGGGGGGGGGDEGEYPPGNEVPNPENPNNPGDKLCKSTFQFNGGSQSSYLITNVSGLKFESIGGINTLPSTHVSLANGITNQAMNNVPPNDYFGLGHTSLQYLQEFFPELFASGAIYSTQQGGQSVWMFSHGAAQVISNRVLNLVAAEIVLIMNSAASIPGNQAAWTTLWTHSNQLIKTFMPGSAIGQGYVPSGGNSNAIYSPNCQ